MHDSVLAFVKRHIHEPVSFVVELGSLDINGSARSLFAETVHYFGVDRQAGLGVDQVCDIEDFRSAFPWQLVICTEVLEHAPDQRAIIDKAFELLIPGGHLVLTAATEPRRPHSGIDENPIRPWEHYRNVDPEEMTDMLEAFEVCEVDTSVLGDFYVCARRPS